MSTEAHFELDVPQALRAQWEARSHVILESYESVLGHPLIARTGNRLEDARRLYVAPFAVLAHATQADPILDYGNAIAISLWETTPEALIATPSRLTAEPSLREARERFMAEVAKTGFVKDYEGVRISAKGRRFLIRNVTVWNLIGSEGRPAGQAATFDQWYDI